MSKEAEAPKRDVLSSDRPASNPETDDTLGLAPYAAKIAESVSRLAPEDGIVLALYGEWGTGKSSALLFIEHYIRKGDPKEQPKIVHFNPWWFSEKEDLTKSLFKELISAFRIPWWQFWKRRWWSITVRLAALGSDVASQAKVPFASILQKVIGFFITKDQSVTQLKSDLEKRLRKKKQRLLVIIDDIDRLSADEIKLLIGLVKSVANFPYITYLLAFDRSIVAHALKGIQNTDDGHAYLEKIVQVPFELPIPDKTSLDRMFFSRLDGVYVNREDKSFDQTRWGNVYYEGIRPLINTPRDVVRVINALSVTYPSVAGEVNFVDFVAIETLRVLNPAIFDGIRRNREHFTGYKVRDDRGKDVVKGFYDSIASKAPGQDQTITQLLRRLFPKLDSVYGNLYWQQDRELEWSRELRVCSDAIFPIYFSYGVPTGDISSTELQDTIAAATDQDTFSQLIMQFADQIRPDGITRGRAFLDRFMDQVETLPVDRIGNVVKSLFDVGDKLQRPEDSRRFMFDEENDIRVLRIVTHLLRRLDKPDRFTLLQEAFSNGQSINMVIHGLYMFQRREEKETEEDAMLRDEHWQELKKIVLERIRAASKDGTLRDVPDLDTVLHAWRDLSGNEEDKWWVAELAATDEGKVRLVEGFLQKRFVQSGFDSIARVQYRLDPEWLEKFIDPYHRLIPRLREIADQDWLTEKQQIAVKQILLEFDMRKAGKDPDVFDAWH